MEQARSERPVALLTGGGTGIGRATAIKLAARGWNVALAGRRSAPLEETLRACREADAACDGVAFPTDITQPDNCHALIETVVDRFGRLDALINNAGGGDRGTAKETTPDSFRRRFDLNAFAPAALIHYAWPIFERQGGGCIVNVSSLSAHDPFPGFFAYGAAKAACESMIRSVHNERGNLNLRAFAVAFGAVETDLLRSYFDEATVPREMCLAPEDVAEVIVGCVTGAYDDRMGQTIMLPIS